jgi:hypothetical protein
MSAMRDGTLYLIDAGDLRRISADGKILTVVTSVSEHKPPPAAVAELNYHMGLWTDDQGRVYIAVAAERLVLRVASEGSAKVVARSEAPWAPSGGMFDREGNLWLLEYDSANAVRARRIGRDGRERIFTAEIDTDRSAVTKSQ